ncbi:MAG: hypothetical protein ACXAD7_10370 [Candidatus Kariarchaeaceae archaeon]|jgi:hypothetical protein
MSRSTDETISKGDWFQKSKSMTHEEDWFPDTETAKKSKFKVLIGTLDEIGIVILIVFIIWKVISYYTG